MHSALLDTRHQDQLRTTLQQRLDQFNHRETSDKTLTAAAVAIAVSAHSTRDEACIYITLRSASLRRHASQLALPGGKVDAGETVTEAALRELSEELGITLDHSHVMGRLDDFPTQSGFTISPIVVWNNSKAPMVINPDEVAHVYEIPFSELLSETLASVDKTQSPPMFSMSPPTIPHKVYSPTAALVYQFREALLLGRPTRVVHYAQPKFAWR